ncbi:MAG: amidohydrolase family protein [Lactobacillus sp.]|jgi:adenine deaminase|nr:amidohydrolase family protein [Lactobacillus sp.]MCI2032317.1 amidohydrolase family protein [Lactobacillus sp.]
MVTVDLLLTNAQVFNHVTRDFRQINVTVKDGKFYWLTQDTSAIQAHQTLDLTGKYLVPGLVDSHMHIESSMTTPTAFGQAAAQYGTTTVIADAHEIANVAGLSGLEAFMAQPSLIDTFYAIPSSVPSTTPELETTGGVIGVAETKALLQDPRVIALGEAMNFHGLTEEPDSLINQIIAACRQARPTLPIEGHCPKYTGLDLAKFIYRGVTSDHTQQTPESLVEKVENGMFIQLQRKSLTPAVVQTVQERTLFEHVALVTDDVMPDDLLHGHLDAIVRLAINLGLDPKLAIYMATYTPARRMGLWDRGLIAPGRVADFIVLDDVPSFAIDAVYKSGQRVTVDAATPVVTHFPDALRQTVTAMPLTVADLALTVPQEGGTVTANVIAIAKAGTFTALEKVPLAVENHQVQWQAAGLSLAVVQERYGHGGHVTFALVKNALNAPGAVGATWAHDHHNILVLGTDLADMVVAQNRLVAEQGGYVVAAGKALVADAPLPIGGVVSDAPIAELGAQIQQVRAQMQALGYENTNELMSFSTLSLLVSPALKVSDKGLFDVKSQQPVPLFD